MSNIRVASLKEPVDVGEYLFRRIHQLGIRSVHGVPGDYNLGLALFPFLNLHAC
jgi:pyruvate decarboxylase